MYLSLLFTLFFGDYGLLELKAMEEMDLEDTRHTFRCHKEYPTNNHTDEKETYYIPRPLVVSILCYDQEIIPLLLKARLFFTCDGDNPALLVHDSSTKFINNTQIYPGMAHEFPITPVIPGDLYLTYKHTPSETKWTYEPVFNLFNNPQGIPLKSFCYSCPENPKDTLCLSQIFSNHIPINDNRSRLNTIIIQLEDKRFASYPFFQKIDQLEINRYRTIYINKTAFL